MGIIHGTHANFEQNVIKNKGVVFVDFYADWCGPCRATAPLIEELSEDKQYKDVVFIKIDVDKEQELAARYNILSIPTFIIFKDGKTLNQFAGARGKHEFESALTSALAS